MSITSRCCDNEVSYRLDQVSACPFHWNTPCPTLSMKRKTIIAIFPNENFTMRKITPLGIKKLSKWKIIVISTFLSELKQLSKSYLPCSQSKQTIAFF